MILVCDANGNILNRTLENVYQGSNLANQVCIVAPLSASSVVNCNIKTARAPSKLYIATRSIPISDTLNMWYIDIQEAVSQYYGSATFQFYFYNSGQLIASGSSKIEIQRGVDKELPAEPTPDVYEAILEALSQVLGDLDNKVNITYIDGDNEQTILNDATGLKLINTDGTNTTIIQITATGVLVNGSELVYEDYVDNAIEELRRQNEDSHSDIRGAIEDIVDGDTIVAKATSDSDGNVFEDTYVKQAKIGNIGNIVGGSYENTITNGLIQTIENKILYDNGDTESSKITLNGHDLRLESHYNDEFSIISLQQSGAYLSYSGSSGYPILTSNDVINNLTSTDINKPLSARQGNIILEELRRQNEEILALQGFLIPQGNWNASTNDPDISTTTETGYYWIVSVAGSTDLGGITDWGLNDWVVKTDTGWAKIDNSEKETAEEVTYDNSTSGLNAENVQEAIDELANVQEAIDELAEEKFGNVLYTYIPDEALTIVNHTTYVEITDVDYTKLTYGITYALKSEYEGLPLTHIGDSAFSGPGMPIYKLILPTSIANIGNEVFFNTFNLTEVKFFNTQFTSEVTIGYRAFAGCKNLVNVELPDTLTIISSGCFGSCSNLKSIKISKSVAFIDGGFGDEYSHGAFENCTSLEEIILPENVAGLGNYAFAGCTSLKNIISLRETPPIIYENTFLDVPATGKTIVADLETYKASDWLTFQPKTLYQYSEETPTKMNLIDKIYSDTATMIADETNIPEGQIVQGGDNFYFYLGTTWGDITDFRKLTDSDKMNIIIQYYDISTMLSSQTAQSYGNMYQVDTTFYKYNGIATGSIDDYDVIGGSMVGDNWINYADNDGMDGDGTESNPFKILTAKHLAYLAKQVNSGNDQSGVYYRLDRNINLGGKIWTSIGVNPNKFNGNFSSNTYGGLKYGVSNLTIVDTSLGGVGNYFGLFGHCGTGSSISNIVVDDCLIIPVRSGMGVLVGSNEGSIYNCYTSGRILGTAGQTAGLGGISGYNIGNIFNCCSNVVIYGYSGLGGISGYNMPPGTITYCSNFGNIKQSNGSAGGIVGACRSLVSNCYNLGNIGGNDGETGIGGIVGELEGGTVDSCYSAGLIEVELAGWVRGVVGYVDGGTILNSYYLDSTVDGGNDATGLNKTFLDIQNLVVDGILSSEYWEDDINITGMLTPALKNIDYAVQENSNYILGRSIENKLDTYETLPTLTLNNVDLYENVFYVGENTETLNKNAFYKGTLIRPDDLMLEQKPGSYSRFTYDLVDEAGRLLFARKINNTDGTYTFTFNGTDWEYDSEVVDLEEWGFTFLRGSGAIADDWFVVTVNSLFSFAWVNKNNTLPEHPEMVYINEGEYLINRPGLVYKILSEICYITIDLPENEFARIISEGLVYIEEAVTNAGKIFITALGYVLEPFFDTQPSWMIDGSKIGNKIFGINTVNQTGALKSFGTNTLPYTSWTGASAPYSKAITVSGVLATDEPDIDLDLSSATYSDVSTIESDWANIYLAVSSADTITFYASEVPTIDIPLQIKVVR